MAQPATAAAHEMRHQGEKDATRARAHRRLQQQVAATRVTAPQIPARPMPGLRPAWSPSPAHHNLARKGRPQPVGPPRGGAAASGPSACKFCSSRAATAGARARMGGRQSAQRGPVRRRRGGDSRAQSQPAQAERQVERPLRLLGQGPVGGLVEERGQATLHCVVVSPGKVRSQARGEHAEQVVGSGRGTKQQKQPRGLQVRQGRGAVGAVHPASHTCGAAHAGRRPRFQAGHRGLGYLAGRRARTRRQSRLCPRRALGGERCQEVPHQRRSRCAFSRH